MNTMKNTSFKENVHNTKLNWANASVPFANAVARAIPPIAGFFGTIKSIVTQTFKIIEWFVYATLFFGGVTALFILLDLPLVVALTCSGVIASLVAGTICTLYRTSVRNLNRKIKALEEKRYKRGSYVARSERRARSPIPVTQISTTKERRTKK